MPTSNGWLERLSKHTKNTGQRVMRIAGIASTIFGCFILLFAVYCFFQFNNMARSTNPQTSPVLDWIAGDILYAETPEVSPSAMANQIQLRIFSGAGVGLFFILAGLCSLLIAKPSGVRNHGGVEG